MNEMESKKTDKSKFIYNIIVSLLYIIMSFFFMFSTGFSNNVAYKVFGVILFMYGIYRIYRTYKHQQNK